MNLVDTHNYYVHPDAKIAENVIIEPFATIHKNVEIGAGTWIGSHAVIMENAKIGKNCKIFPGAVVSAKPQDLKYDNEYTETIIGDNVTIREYATINRGTRDKNKTEIGDNSLVMAYCHIAHDCIVGKNCILANNVNLAGHIHIDDHVVIGGMTAVQQFLRIGKHAYIAGGSLIRKDVPPYIKAAREPLSYAGVNSIGLRRRGYTSETIHHIQDIYRYLFVRKYNISQAVAIIETELNATEYRDEIIDFVRRSNKGVLRGFKQRNENRG